MADLLTWLLLRPDMEHTLSALAADLHAPLSTVYRETSRLAAAEIVNTRSIGRAKVVRINLSYRLIRPLTDLLIGSFGPHVVIGDEFAGLTGVRMAVIYGSWAARYQGEAGPPPRDVDVLVVGHPERSDIYDAADRAQQRLGLPVNPTISSPERWAAASDSLIRTVQQSPMVTVFDTPGMSTGASG